MQKVEERLELQEKKLEALTSQRATGPPSQQHEDPSFDTAHEAIPPSQLKSNMASSQLVRPDITETEHCELMAKCMNLTLKVAVGYVLPPGPDGTFHYNPIPDGYAIVGVDEVKPEFEGLDLEYPTGEGETHLVDAVRTTILWRKENVRLP